LIVDKKPLTKEVEKRIKDFIQKSKEKNKEVIEKLKSSKK
jgi:hypothetical protein